VCDGEGNVLVLPSPNCQNQLAIVFRFIEAEGVNCTGLSSQVDWVVKSTNGRGSMVIVLYMVSEQPLLVKMIILTV
jgi:hypothetical protein